VNRPLLYREAGPFFAPGKTREFLVSTRNRSLIGRKSNRHAGGVLSFSGFTSPRQPLAVRQQMKRPSRKPSPRLLLSFRDQAQRSQLRLHAGVQTKGAKEFKKKIAPMCDQLVLRTPKQPLGKLYDYASINFNESNH
jgi:hypothetical protein